MMFVPKIEQVEKVEKVERATIGSARKKRLAEHAPFLGASGSRSARQSVPALSPRGLVQHATLGKSMKEEGSRPDWELPGLPC